MYPVERLESRKPFASYAAAACALLLSVGAARAAEPPQYTFRNVTLISMEGGNTLACPKILNDGTVVFREPGGFSTGPNPEDRLLDTSAYHSVGDDFAVSESRTIVFNGREYPTGTTYGLYKGPNPLTNAVVKSGGPFIEFGIPATNNHGGLAFRGQLGNGTIGIFRGPNPATDTVATTVGPYGSDPRQGGSRPFGDPVINDAGTIAFYAGLDAGGHGIFTGSNPATDARVTNAGPYSTIANDYIGISGAGKIVFRADVVGGYGLFTGPDPIADAIITGQTGFGVGPVISDNGHIAFWADFGDGFGIYTGDDPVNDKVIGPFDTLFGLDVGFNVAPEISINDKGEIAFIYYVAGAAQLGIAVASPVPEPASAALLCALGTFGVAPRRRCR